MKILKSYDPIITLFREGMSHFEGYIMNNRVGIPVKRQLVNMFRAAFQFLIMFVRMNKENQEILVAYCEVFLKYLKFDLGQVQLICEIYRDNIDLLQRVDQKLIDVFIRHIEQEGRQANFLEFFPIIMRCKTEMIFENQLMVINSFLPLNAVPDKEYKILYAETPKKSGQLRF